MEDADALVEPLQHPHFRIIALNHTLGRKLFHQDFGEEAFQSVARLAERLQDHVIAVAVNDHRRQQIRLAIDHTVGVGIFNHQLAVSGRPANSRCKKCAVNGNVLASKKTDRNLRLVAIECASKKVAAFVGEPDHGARSGLGRPNIAAIDPEVARAKAFDAPGGDYHGSFCHWSCGCHGLYARGRGPGSGARRVHLPLLVKLQGG